MIRYRPSLVPVGALIVALAMLMSACGGKLIQTDPRHKAAVAVQAVAESLFAVQDAEGVLYAFCTISQDQHRAINRQLVKALTLTQSAAKVVIVWHPGLPAPAELAQLLPALQALTGDIVTQLPQAQQAQLWPTIVAVYQAVAVCLILFGG